MAHRCVTALSLNTARRSLKPSAPHLQEWSRVKRQKASNGERNLSNLCIAVETVTYKDTSHKRVTSDSILEQRREHSGAKQLGSRGKKKKKEAKSDVFEQD